MIKLLKFRIKWFFHCLFNMHQQMEATTDKYEVLVGCYQCNKLNDKHGNVFTMKKGK